MKLINSSIVVDKVTTIPTVRVALEMDANEFDKIMEGLRFVSRNVSHLASANTELYDLLKSIWLWT